MERRYKKWISLNPIDELRMFPSHEQSTERRAKNDNEIDTKRGLFKTFGNSEAALQVS